MNIKEIIDAERWGSQRLKDGSWWGISHDASLDRVEAAVNKRIKNLTSQTSAVKYGCHADLDPDMEPDDCVILTDNYKDCIFAKRGMKPEDCKYWKPVMVELPDVIEKHSQKFVKLVFNDKYCDCPHCGAHVGHCYKCGAKLNWEEVE